MAKSGAQAQAEKPEAQKGNATKMPIFPTKFDGSGSDNTDEFRRTLIGHVELQGIAASFYKALLKGELSCTAQCLVDHEPRKNDPEAPLQLRPRKLHTTRIRAVHRQDEF